MSQEFIDNVYDSTFVVGTTMANVEKNFAALKSTFSGTAAPSNPVAGMWWYDTTANILKLRNEANNAWQNVWNFGSNKPVIANLSNEITNAMCAASLKDPAAGTAGLRTLGTGATQAVANSDARLSDERIPLDGSVTAAKLSYYQAGNLLCKSADTERSIGNSTSPVKKKEITTSYGGTFRIKFKLRSADNWDAIGRIYRNGTAIGTTMAQTVTGEAEFSEDISGWLSGDAVQLYGWTNATPSLTYCSDFRIYRQIDFSVVID